LACSLIIKPLSFQLSVISYQLSVPLAEASELTSEIFSFLLVDWIWRTSERLCKSGKPRHPILRKAPKIDRFSLSKGRL
ncbi:MAG: hypothetical protein QNJ74_16590, partial [Trichodesmium sp. MO_231.B1]|nr:hypothetical protein [Trichodesmium sp. MO_231.B1]